jgi:hypothetical protein
VKKILLVAVALVLGLSGAAFAIQAEIPADTTAAIAKGGTQVTIDGELRFRGANYQNISDFNSNVANGPALTTATLGNANGYGPAERNVFETRVRLGVKAQVSPNTVGYIQLEGAGAAGATGENTNWGSSNGQGGTNAYGTFRKGEDKTSPMQIMQAWIQHSGSGLIGVPAYIKVGHQPITIGAGIFYKHSVYGDDAVVVGVTPVKGLDISAVYVKLNESLVNSADDMDLYSTVVSYAINKDIVLGLDLSFLQGQDKGANNGAVVTPVIGAVSTGTAATAYDKFLLFDAGFNAKATFMNALTVKGTFDIQLGRRTFTNDPGNAAIKAIVGADKQTFRGFAGTFGVAYTMAPATVAFDFGYGSGDASGNSKKLSTFMTAQGHTWSQPGTFIYEYLTVNAAGNVSGGLQNTIYAKLSGAVDVTKSLNFGGSLTGLMAAAKAYGDGGYMTGTRNTTSRYIGTEVDMKASYQIDKGLKYFVEGGYLFAGNFWKGATGTDTAQRVTVNNPWGIRHGIQLNF